MSDKKPIPCFDHMPAGLAKVIAEQAKQQAQTSSQPKATEDSGGGEQKK